MTRNSSGKDPPKSSNQNNIKESLRLAMKQKNKNPDSAINTAIKKKCGVALEPRKTGKKAKGKTSVSVNEDMETSSVVGDDDSLSTHSNTTVINTDKNVKTKPICVSIGNEKILELKNSIIQLQLNKDFKIKATSKDEIQIFTYDKLDKSKIQSFLESSDNKYQFHTFTERDEKDLIYVMKGHYFVEPKSLLKMLTDNNCPASSVNFLNNNKANPSYIVHFPKNSVNLILLRTQFKSIDHCIVKWESFNNKKKKLTQCYRCQRFGHTARNCHHEYRCVKCTDIHEPGQCSRKTLEGNPKCVNCGKEHAANNRNCEVFISYKEKLDKLKKPKIVQLQQNQPRSFVSTKAPWATQPLKNQDFPPLIPSVNSRMENIRTYSSNDNLFVNENSSQINELKDIQNSFTSIPNISETLRLFREMTEKLKSTDCQKTRLSILIEYTVV